jgi:hypothetical protein
MQLSVQLTADFEMTLTHSTFCPFFFTYAGVPKTVTSSSRGDPRDICWQNAWNTTFVQLAYNKIGGVADRRLSKQSESTKRSVGLYRKYLMAGKKETGKTLNPQKYKYLHALYLI